MRHRDATREPADAPALDLQSPDVRRGERQGVERAEQIVREARLDQLSGTNRPARLRRLLQHQHIPAAVGEQIRRHEAVVAGADHDRVRHQAVS